MDDEMDRVSAWDRLAELAASFRQAANAEKAARLAREVLAMLVGEGRFRSHVLRLAKRKNLDPGDLTQVFCLSVLRLQSLEKFDSTRGDLWPYIRGILKKTAGSLQCYECVRQRVLVDDEVIASMADTASNEPVQRAIANEDATANGEESRRLNEAVQLLGKTQRPVVELRLYHDYSFEQIALELGIPRLLVYSRWKDARRRLQSLLARRPAE